MFHVGSLAQQAYQFENRVGEAAGSHILIRIPG
jgi:hypothetical protein